MGKSKIVGTNILEYIIKLSSFFKKERNINFSFFWNLNLKRQQHDQIGVSEPKTNPFRLEVISN